jgi:hypothetical protein
VVFGGLVVVGIVDWLNRGAFVVAVGEEHPTASNDRITSEINKNLTEVMTLIQILLYLDLKLA